MEVNKFITDNREIFERLLKSENEKPFNILLSASSKYYYENLHSYILVDILNRTMTNGEMKYLRLFLQFLNSIIPCINEMEYLNTRIEREEGRIDLLIEDRESKKCIILENKINKAVDQEKQLPRYVIAQREKGFEIDVIVYLSLDGRKSPDPTTWSDYEKEFMKQIKRIDLASYKFQEKCLVNGFIDRCQIESNDLAEFSFLKQYRDLLIYLAKEGANMEHMEDFYNLMKDSTNFDLAISIRDSLGQLIQHRQNKIFDEYKSRFEPFERIVPYQENDTIFIKLNSYKEQIKLDIVLSEKETTLCFWVNEEVMPQENIIENILMDIDEINSFEMNDKNNYRKTFKFPDEETLLRQYIEVFLEKLKNHISKKNG